MKKKFEQRLKELERKSEFYDMVTVRVANDCGLKEEFDGIGLNHELAELKEEVGASKNTRKIVIASLVTVALAFAYQLYSSRQ